MMMTSKDVSAIFNLFLSFQTASSQRERMQGRTPTKPNQQARDFKSRVVPISSPKNSDDLVCSQQQPRHQVHYDQDQLRMTYPSHSNQRRQRRYEKSRAHDGWYE